MPFNPAQVKVRFNLEDVHETSIDIISLLEDLEIDDNEAAVALALSLGRILSPHTLDQDEQVKFTQDLMEWAGCYFAQGQVN